VFCGILGLLIDLGLALPLIGQHRYKLGQMIQPATRPICPLSAI
jgi:hypothetical protein